MPDTQSDPDFLRNQAYNDAFDLDTRISIQKAYGSHSRKWFEWLFDHFNLPPHSRILELGSGPGDLWKENSYRLSPGWQVLISDLSPGMVQEARRRLGEKDTQFYYSIIDAQKIPVATRAAFDALVANGLLDHVPEFENAMDEFRRVLKPGGYLYTSTGGRAHLREMEAMLKPFLPGADYGGAPERFGIENGARLLAPWSGDIHFYRYDDELVFTKADPILAYVLSEAAARERLTGDKLDALTGKLESRLAKQGEIRVKVDKGLFVARM